MDGSPRAMRGQVAALALIPLLYFAAVAPTLTWQEFGGGSENLNVATALEMRRNDRWLVPTLQGAPRVAKPPLTAWVTASLLRGSTLREISSTDPAVRRAAFDRLAWEVRWPALLMGAITLLAVYELGRMVGGWRMAIVAAAVCGTSYAFLRFTRNATTDVPLALFVTVANVFMAKALLEGQRWTGCMGVGIALGLAFMAKGPVALVQTLAPALAFAGWRAWDRRRGDVRGGERRGWAAPILLGAVLMLAISLPWFVVVTARWHAPAMGTAELPWILRPVARVTGNAQLWNLWYRETTRQGAITLEPDPWYAHASLIPMMLPWILTFIGGLISSMRDVAMGGREEIGRGDRQRTMYALLLLLVPLLLMSLSRDRKDRYLLPMIGPAAMVAAYGLMDHLRTWRRPTILDRVADLSHWGIVAAAGIAFPLVGMSGWMKDLRTLEGQPWFAPALGMPAAAGGLVILVGGVLLYRRWPGGMTLATVLVMLMAHPLYAYGYSRAEGRSELRALADRVWQERPGARVQCYLDRNVPQEFSIYLNRETPLAEKESEILGQTDVLLMLDRDGAASLAPPAGWTLLGSERRKKDRWMIYGR